MDLQEVQSIQSEIQYNNFFDNDIEALENNENMELQMENYGKQNNIEVKYSTIHGRGVFATDTILKGNFKFFILFYFII